jgi:signal peptidase I
VRIFSPNSSSLSSLPPSSCSRYGFFVAQPFIVSGESMSPRLKTANTSLSTSFPTACSAPQRGDVIIFSYPRNPKEFFIKRIIGLPGEKVAIKGGAISVTKADGSAVTLSESYVKNIGNGGDATYRVEPASTL